MQAEDLELGAIVTVLTWRVPPPGTASGIAVSDIHLAAANHLFCGAGLVVESVSHPYVKVRVLSLPETHESSRIVLDSRCVTFTKHPKDMLLPNETKHLTQDTKKSGVPANVTDA